MSELGHGRHASSVANSSPNSCFQVFMEIGFGVDLFKPCGFHLETILGAAGFQMEVMFDPGGVFLRFFRLSKIGSEICDFLKVAGWSWACPGDTIQDFHCHI